MATTYKKFKTKSLRSRVVRKAYDALGSEYALVQAIIRHRLRKGLTQAELAEKIGTRQPVISRLERGEGNPSLDTLQRIAGALDVSLSVSLK
jgi:ribosome-binding protein aMBF1 (putative translation factor)